MHPQPPRQEWTHQPQQQAVLASCVYPPKPNQNASMLIMPVKRTRQKPSPPSQTAPWVLILWQTSLVQRNSTHIGSLSRLRPPDTYPHFSKMAKPSCPSPTRKQDKDRFSQPNPRRLMARQEWLSVDRPPEGSPQTRFGQSPTRRQGNSLRADQSGKKGPTTAPAPQAGTCIHLQ